MNQNTILNLFDLLTDSCLALTLKKLSKQVAKAPCTHSHVSTATQMIDVNTVRLELVRDSMQTTAGSPLIPMKNPTWFGKVTNGAHCPPQNEHRSQAFPLKLFKSRPCAPMGTRGKKAKGPAIVGSATASTPLLS